jgi:multidrug transporter EmrE-like cation transporter
MMNFLLILSSVTLNALAQLLVKKGMTVIGKIDVSISSIGSLIPQLIVNGYIIGGLGSYVVSIFIWFVVLSRVQVSYAYPYLSIGYIITAVAAYLFLGESLSLYKIAGILIICVGIIILSIGASK